MVISSLESLLSLKEDRQKALRCKLLTRCRLSQMQESSEFQRQSFSLRRLLSKNRWRLSMFQANPRCPSWS